MSVLVVGSINVDFTFYTKEFLKPGQTITGQSLKKFHGGKGANQAIAASRISDKTAFIGAIGKETDNTDIINNFINNQVDCKNVFEKPGQTGSAFINVVDGENAIAVIAGANAMLTVTDVENIKDYIKTFSTVVMQLEIPSDVVERVAQIAKEAGATIIIDPAPSSNCTQKILDLATFIKPNEYEYKDLKSRFNLDENKCITTYGSKGVEYYKDKELIKLSGEVVNVVDTTGAGDVFSGVFAAVYDKTNDLDYSLERAVKYSAVAVTKEGAQVDFLK